MLLTLFDLGDDLRGLDWSGGKHFERNPWRQALGSGGVPQYVYPRGLFIHVDCYIMPLDFTCILSKSHSFGMLLRLIKTEAKIGVIFIRL